MHIVNVLNKKLGSTNTTFAGDFLGQFLIFFLPFFFPNGIKIIIGDVMVLSLQWSFPFVSR
jgi:hypothetical protein